MEEKKINNNKVQVFKQKFNEKKILHKDLINIPYFATYIFARRGCGKTNIAGNIIFQVAIPKYTILRIFSSCIDQDLTLQSIIKKCEKYKLEYELFDNIYDEEGNDLFLKQFEEIKLEVSELKEKLDKSKIAYPLYIYYIDDNNDILRNNKNLENFFYRFRHLKCVFILSSQSYKHIKPSIRSNLDLIIIPSKDIPMENLKLLYDERINSKKLSFDKFLDIYTYATKDRFNFLYINVNDNLEFRKNFDTLITY